MQQRAANAFTSDGAVAPRLRHRPVEFNLLRSHELFEHLLARLDAGLAPVPTVAKPDERQGIRGHVLERLHGKLGGSNVLLTLLVLSVKLVRTLFHSLDEVFALLGVSHVFERIVVLLLERVVRVEHLGVALFGALEVPNRLGNVQANILAWAKLGPGFGPGFGDRFGTGHL